MPTPLKQCDTVTSFDEAIAKLGALGGGKQNPKIACCYRRCFLADSDAFGNEGHV